MADIQKELSNLRAKITTIIASNEIWDTIPGVSQSLGLSLVDKTAGLGKFKYLNKVTKETDDKTIISAAEKFLTNYPGERMQPNEADLQEIQDSLWWIESNGDQQISNVTRIRIIESFEGTAFWGRLSLRDFFNPILPSVVSFTMPEVGSDGNLYIGLGNQIFANLLSGKNSAPLTPSKVSVVDYLQEIGLLKWPDKRFCLFIERILHPEVQPPDKQKGFINKLEELLEQDGFILFQESEQGGLPVYKIQKRKAGVSGSPKYIIFASSGPKPEIVFDDAVNMDIRIVKNTDFCLVYDQPPINGDLTWQMLLEWWGKKEGLDPDDDKVRRDFGKRLQASLQSVPERIFFDTYFKEFKEKFGDRLPALIPQVYLHYDPRSRIERSKPVLFRQKMDFLILLRNATRIVIEIDGKQHYANENGLASPQRYAEMVSEDRRIKLLGYEIYRFGGAEFADLKDAHNVIVAFFNELFSRYEVASIINKKS